MDIYLALLDGRGWQADEFDESNAKETCHHVDPFASSSSSDQKERKIDECR
jgi:hypothetical protein